MNQPQCTELFCAVEREYPVNEITHRGVLCWPMIRSTLMSQLLYRDHQQTASGHRAPWEPSGLLAKIRYGARSSLTHAKNLTRPRFATPPTLRTPTFLSYSHVSGRHQIVSGKGFNKFTDALHVLLRDEAFVYEIGEQRDVRPEDYHRPPIDIEVEVRHQWAVAHFRGGAGILPVEDVVGLGSLREHLRGLPEAVDLDGDAFRSQMQTIHVYRRVFRSVLRTVRPELVFLGCFYHPRGYALSLACRDLAIRSVELQHGQQGDHHPMYNGWTCPPRGGYASIPEVFWMWGERSVRRIEAWAGRTHYHRALLGGNPWLTFCREHPSEVSQDNAAWFGRLDDHRGSVALVSLQPVALTDCVPDFLLEAMASSPEVLWCIRLHPTMISERSKVKERLGSALAGRYELERSTSAPLYELLAHVDVHLTGWSSVAYEALALGVHTILTHPNGRDAMGEYVRKGIFGYADNVSDLLRLLGGHTFEPEDDEPFMVCDGATVRKAVAKLRSQGFDRE